MTALTLYSATNGIIMAADSAAYTLDGVVSFFQRKLIGLDDQQCILANAGISGLGDRAASILSQDCHDFDGVLDVLVGVTRETYDWCARNWHEHYPDIEAPRGTLILGGWSASRKAFEAYKIHSATKPVIRKDTGEESVAPAWTIIPVDGFWASSQPSEESRARCGVADTELFELLAKNPIEASVRYVCANRSDSGDHGDGAYGVGGWVDVAVLMETKIEIITVHHWPDRVGEQIDPESGDLLPQWMETEAE